MNTKLNNAAINPEFESLFSFKNNEEKIEHNAQMISYRILSEVEKLCEEKNIKKKDLADLVETSRSYITQLFRGTKHVNTQIMARFEEALNVTFDFRIKLNEESHEEFMGKQINWEMLQGKRFPAKDYVLFWYQKDRKTTSGFLNKIPRKDLLMQNAG